MHAFRCKSRALLSISANQNIFRGIHQPASRRKRGSGGSGPTAIVDFDFEVKKVMDQIYKAIDPLMVLNDSFKLSRDDHKEEILLDADKKGFYIFRVDRGMQRLFVQTPISGAHQYEFSPEDKTWLDVRDKHDMRGLVTRDLLRHARGCPKF